MLCAWCYVKSLSPVWYPYRVFKSKWAVTLLEKSLNCLLEGNLVSKHMSKHNLKFSGPISHVIKSSCNQMCKSITYEYSACSFWCNEPDQYAMTNILWTVKIMVFWDVALRSLADGGSILFWNVGVCPISQTIRCTSYHGTDHDACDSNDDKFWGSATNKTFVLHWHFVY